MKERPILFSTEMVQAILRGDKTQTRRVVKPQPTKSKHSKDGWDYDIKGKWAINVPEKQIDCSFLGIKGKCPYGKVGDLLWVRETFATIGKDFCYKASMREGLFTDRYRSKYKPSIHMPKSAARIWLKVTDVRVERLHQITEEDAVKEGIGQFTKDGVGFKYGIQGWFWSCLSGQPFMCKDRRTAFEELWQSINGTDSWNANPWVWVVEFEVISKTGKP